MSEQNKLTDEQRMEMKDAICGIIDSSEYVHLAMSCDPVRDAEAEQKAQDGYKKYMPGPEAVIRLFAELPTAREKSMSPSQMAQVVRLARVYREASRRWNDAMDSRNPDGCDNAHAELELACTALFAALDRLDGDKDNARQQ